MQAKSRQIVIAPLWHGLAAQQRTDTFHPASSLMSLLQACTDGAELDILHNWLNPRIALG